MKYKIGTRIDFIEDGEEDYCDYYEVVAYAITKDAQVVYLIWDSGGDAIDKYQFMPEDELAEVIKDYENDGYTVKIREGE